MERYQGKKVVIIGRGDRSGGNTLRIENRKAGSTRAIDADRHR